MTRCPTCGRALPRARLSVDLGTNTLVAGGRVVKLRPLEAEIMHPLIAAAPATVSVDRIIRALWGGGDIPIGARQMISTNVANMRRFVAPLGIVIEAVPGRGYRLIRS